MNLVKPSSILRPRTALILAGSIAALLSGHSAQAAVKTWTGTTSGNWATGTNWGGTAPLTGDSLVLTSATGAGGLTLSDNLMTPGSFSIAGITFNSGSGAYVVNPATPGTNGFTLTGNVLNSSTNLQTINDLIATIAVRTFTMTTGGGNITLGGVVSGTAGGITTAGTGILTLGATANSYTGATTIATGTTLSLTGTITGGGTITANGSGILSQASTGGISGATKITLNGTGTSTLAGTNSFTGGTDINIGKTLNLTGTYSGGNTINVFGGTLTESGTGVISGLTQLFVNSGGVVTLSGANTFTGGVTLSSGGGGTLNLDFSAAGAPVTNILNNGLVSGGSGVTSAGTINITGASGATNSQRLNAINFSASTATGFNAVQNGATSLSVALGGITRNANSSVDFTLPTTGAITTTTTTASGASSDNLLVNSTGTGVAYATVNGGSTFATNTLSGLQTIGGLATYSTGTGNYTSLNNIDVTAGDSVSGVTTNTLRFNGAAIGLTLAGINDLRNGAILVTPDSTGATISGGTLRSGSGLDLVVHNYGAISISSVIANSSSGASAVAFTGTGTTTLSGPNTYTGNTAISKGTVILGVGQVGTTSGAFGTGSGALSMGNGTTLDLAGNNLTVGAFGLTGTSATIGSTTAATLRFTGSAALSGLTVTGNTTLDMGGGGSLGTTLFSGTGGTLLISSNVGRQNNLQGALASANLAFNNAVGFQTTTGQTVTGSVSVSGTTTAWNFQGNTTLNGSLIGAGTLSLDNGNAPTFTYAGNVSGFTGTLNVNSTNQTATYSLTNATGGGFTSTKIGQNPTGTGSTILQWGGTGATQTIQIGDLSSTSSSSATTPVTLRNQGAAASVVTFQVGGLNVASSIYGGVITNGTGINQTTAITKVGTGIWRLTGANTYTGMTTVGTSAAGNANITSATANGGTLEAGVAGALTTTTAITVNNGGTLLLSGSGTLDRVSTTAGISLGTTGGTGVGGTIARTGTASEGSGAVVTGGTPAGTNALGFGTLTLSSSSTLDFETGSVGSLVFTGFTQGGFTLSIIGYANSTFDASQNSGTATDDRLIFNISGGLSGAQLAAINFGGGFAAGQISLGGDFYEVGVTPIPEPGTVLGALALLGLVGYRERRRVGGWWGRVGAQA